MVIDIFTHVYPRPVLDRLNEVAPDLGAMAKFVDSTPQLHDMEARFRVMDKFGDYRQVISLGSPPIETLTGPAHGGEVARIANDAMAELVARHPDRFPGFAASLAMDDMTGAMAELHRAMDELGAAGVQIFTEIDGRPIDDPEFEPVFAAMAAYGRPIWMHPARSAQMSDFPAESEARFDVWQILGWPYMTSVAMMRLVLTGLFDRHPGIEIVTHHLGGIIPYHAERLAVSMQRVERQRERLEDGDSAGGGNYMRRPPIDQIKMFYGDTAMSGAVAPLRCGLDFFGLNNVVFASDAPFGSIRKELDAVDRLDLAADSRHRILAGNAERLLRRPPAARG